RCPRGVRRSGRGRLLEQRNLRRPAAGDRSLLMIDTIGLARMLEHTRRLRAGFATTAPRPWDRTTAGAELAVQLGHLAQCIAQRHGIDLLVFQDPARPITRIGDELSDVALAALSITTLTGYQPPVLPKDAPLPCGNGSVAEDIAQLLVLVVAA